MNINCTDQSFDVINIPERPECILCDSTTEQMFKTKIYGEKYVCMNCANKIESILHELREPTKY